MATTNAILTNHAFFCNVLPSIKSEFRRQKWKQILGAMERLVIEQLEYYHAIGFSDPYYYSYLKNSKRNLEEFTRALDAHDLNKCRSY